tara:strand:+ start:9149 stop:10069 length:921 start_codon:yes stop_codon:yes gene_type:complete
MNWITKFIKPKIKSLFKKKTSTTDETLWISCKCKNLIFKEDFKSNFYCCTKCGSHHKLSCKERFKLFFDSGIYEILDTPLPVDDPLGFVDNKKYKDRLQDARKKTGQDDAILIAKGKVKNIDVTVGAQDFRFIGGSFGAASGEAFITGVQHAINNKTPLVFFSCSGGQRMMESSIALMQMTRTTLAINELKKNNLPYIVVFTDPTTGGVTASWGMLGDILIAEPKATIGFAGRRVIQDTVRETLPEEFQTAEYVKNHGGIDLVIERKYLNSTIGTLLSVMLKKSETQAKKENINAITIDQSLQSAS